MLSFSFFLFLLQEGALLQYSGKRGWEERGCKISLLQYQGGKERESIQFFFTFFIFIFFGRGFRFKERERKRKRELVGLFFFGVGLGLERRGMGGGMGVLVGDEYYYLWSVGEQKGGEGGGSFNTLFSLF